MGLENKIKSRVFRELWAAAGAAKTITESIEGDGRVSRTAARGQLTLVRKEIHDIINVLFLDKIKRIVVDGRYDAAEAAMRARLNDDKNMLVEIYRLQNPRDYKAFEASEIAKARRNVDAMMRRVTGESYIPLSQSVYRSRDLSRGWVDRMINVNLARGASAKELAAAVQNSIKPTTPGGISYAAMRLARTEINNAYHCQAISDIEDNPFVGEAVWHLSDVHKPDPGDLCEKYAAIGTFDKDDIPRKPHPHCRCFIVPKTMEWDDFEAALMRGDFDQDGEEKIA
jgi:hypothetical protein